MNFPSKLIEQAVNQLAKLPGIGKKTALRLVLYMLREDASLTESLAQALLQMRRDVKQCAQCFNLADAELCAVCANTHRDASIICVIENSADLLAIENTAQYAGLYHVLGGVISPIEGIGPADLKIAELLDRVRQNPVKEVIIALNATMEADTTAFYLTKKLKELGVRVTTIARGVPIGGELEYTDEVTLGRSIVGRVAFDA